jgi:hypothetical protein
MMEHRQAPFFVDANVLIGSLGCARDSQYRIAALQQPRHWIQELFRDLVANLFRSGGVTERPTYQWPAR